MEKSCENCRFYIQHYVKARTNLISACCGHCIRRGVYNKNTDKICEHWEEKIDTKSDTVKSVISTLENIQKRVCDIALILNNIKVD